jgi:hypothetical protein
VRSCEFRGLPSLNQVWEHRTQASVRLMSAISISHRVLWQRFLNFSANKWCFEQYNVTGKQYCISIYCTEVAVMFWDTGIEHQLFQNLNSSTIAKPWLSDSRALGSSKSRQPFLGMDRGGEEFLMYQSYPLVICYIAIEHDHRNSGISH